ncbi:carboxypeptidase-like regulatory domain-containing protein [Spirosoma pollinicola]|uniref:Carboxypeptidase-like regulatory domain-containing protein n=1 Tax=Spirosoma pollinicola TaxID=2057025 RepID=A0A2K8YTA9_9BACT|nr:hypothetical protein [Spirosoma pollinicola]AUD00863.1 hypothetical protein CWM47_02960 [Spirosoma pollinicola]
MDIQPQSNASVVLLVLLIFLLINQSSTYAQTDYVFQGKVVDAKTEQPLSYITLSMADGQISSETNKNGYFILKVPEHLKKDTLYLRALNYQLAQQPLTELAPVNSIIRLNAIPSESQVSTVDQYFSGAHSFQARDTLLKAIALIAKNYTDSPTLLHGFYREIIEKLQPSFCVSYTEGIIDVYKPSYYFTKKDDQIHFVKGRRKPLYTFTIPVLTPGPWASNMLDIVKYQEFLFRHGKLNQDYIFNLVGKTIIGDQPVYIIDFNPRSHQVSSGFFAGKLFLTTNGLAIIRSEYRLTEQGLNLINRSSNAQVYSTNLKGRSYTATYTKFGDRWSFQSGSITNNFTDVATISSFESRIDFVVTHRQSDNIQPFKAKDQAVYNRLPMQSFDRNSDEFLRGENYLMPVLPYPSLIESNK